MPDALEKLRIAASRNKLLIITGAGVSKSLAMDPPAPSWPELVLSGVNYCFDRGLVSPVQKERLKDQLSSDDIDDLLTSAEFITRKLGSSGSDIYARWLEEAVGNLKYADGPMAAAIRLASDSGTPLATLNYDTVLEQVTQLPTIGIGDSRHSIQWMNGEIRGIFHIHGVWSLPSTCILGIRDYHDAVVDERRLLIQRAMATFSSLLFVGCGETFGDPNFETLIEWMRENVGAAMPHHFALVRDAEYNTRLADKGWQGFVTPVSYGTSHDELPNYISQIFAHDQPVQIQKQTSTKRAIKAEGSAVIAYRKFLIRDCGQMTIEGIRADMETAKQRFDIEKLFVPLEFNPVPPESMQRLGDDSEEKAAWLKNNPGGLPFGAALKKAKSIALLALPGGGKTMLLKRLAVAYADPSRLSETIDNLPKLDVLPIVIRCREWKDHIRSPLPVVLERMFEITGDHLLKGFAQEVEGHLKKGKVLLLIDGLDEIHDDASRSIFVEHLESFLAAYPKIRMVITSREAGFNLVAPTIVRFCERWRIAPLPETSIRLLSSYWHLLMMPRDKEAEHEAETVADVLIKSPALRRLAENPLLLTMLLVVKHGAGRLPPDRVSLYSRATEVLLDTWNIKGHSALNIKEAVPQLSCLAFELLIQGKQTATASEMIDILERARESIPQISRYARDDAKSFLQRVELRSSLLIETGYRAEGTMSVPIYQFRHLTFQEYLAAVAVTEGHYFNYKKDDTVVTPLIPFMLTEEWKEVVPMVAVLARKQAAPLLRELVQLGCDHKLDQELTGKVDHYRPESVGRLTQALIEEAEFPSDILNDAYTLVALFAHGCNTSDNWSALAKGPYGADIRDTAFSMFIGNREHPLRSLRNTVAMLEAFAQTDDFWEEPTTPSVIISRLLDSDSMTQARTALLVCGSLWLFRSRSPLANLEVYTAIERAVPGCRSAMFEAIGWAFGFIRYLRIEADMPPYGCPEPSVLATIVDVYLDHLEHDTAGIPGFVVDSLSTIPRQSWPLVLTERGRVLIADHIEQAIALKGPRSMDTAAVIIAYFAKSQFDDEYVKRALGFNRRVILNSTEQVLSPLYMDLKVPEPASAKRRPTQTGRRRKIKRT